MRPLVTTVIAVSIAAQATAAELSPADNHELQQLARSMDDAWTAGDANANAQLFAIDATARFGEDMLAHGRADIRDQFVGFFKDRPAGLRHVTKIERVEQLDPDFAIWDAEIRVERQEPAGQWATLTRIRNVTVVVRQAEGWLIKAVRAFPVKQ
jgi:uncharacterized protein (TIGR02246 family)